MNNDNFIVLNGINVQFQIINSKKLKNTYLHIKDNIVIIKSRKISLDKAKEIINIKSEWILKNLDKSNKKAEKREEIKEFKTIRFLGKEYDSEVIEQSITRDISIYFNDKFLIFVNPQYINNKDFILNGIYEFYRKKAEKEIPQYVYEWSKIMQLKPNKISFKKLKKRWGSCSHDNNLCFNIKIMALDKNQIDYIIVHELSHIVQKNHSKAFWDLVKKYLPNYKEIHDKTLIEVV